MIIAGCQNASFNIRPFDKPTSLGAAVVWEEGRGVLANPPKGLASNILSQPTSFDVAPLTVPASNLRPRPRPVTRPGPVLDRISPTSGSSDTSRDWETKV